VIYKKCTYKETLLTENIKPTSITVFIGEPVNQVTTLDANGKVVKPTNGAELRYVNRATVTGSAPFKQILTFIYNIVTKLAVIGGGLLGLRAAKAMKELALDTYLPPYAAPTRTTAFMPVR
jgi:NAD(P)H-nitrite reductase large subunit